MPHNSKQRSDHPPSSPHKLLALCLGLGLFISSLPARAATPEPSPKPVPPASADEPLAASYSPAASARFLDSVGVRWTQNRKCATCHTNVPYLMARPALKEAPSEDMAVVRRFFEERVAHWDDRARGAAPRNDSEVVAIAAALAVNDAQTTGKLHPLTRKALARMWARQRAEGAWDWEKCTWPPLEYDDYYGAVLAAVGVGLAPEGYARSEEARAGLARLKQYLRKTPAPNLHHRTWLLWASTRVEGLMTADERRQAVKDLLATQQKDGGWSLPSLGDWNGFDGRENNTRAPSDGYGTGLAVYVLRQAELPADHEAIQKGVRWLRGHQRASGRWFTQSLNTDKAHYISNAGTAFAVLALTACKEK
jgi:squalene-hopene/tetraprenyl-beta-curcumene cyclase